MRRTSTDRADPAPAPLVSVAPAGCGPGDIVGGYRLLRRLGAGDDAEVFLGIAQAEPDDSNDHTAAVKVFRPHVHPARIGAEIEALSRLRHAHLLRLGDVALAPSGAPCLITERLSAGSLAALVTGRPVLAAGEAVTILAPLASAIDSMHASGVVHGRLTLSSVLFRDSGAPVVVGFGGATTITPDLPPARVSTTDGVMSDRRALATIVAAVLARVVAERSPDAPEREVALVFPEPDLAADDFGAVLADRLFELAEPRPVRLARVQGPGAPSPPARIGHGSSGVDRSPTPFGEPATVNAAQRPRRRHAAVAGAGEGESPSVAIARAVATLTRLPTAVRSGALGRTVATHARGVRPRFWIAGAIVTVSLMIGLAVVPAGDTGARDAAPQPRAPAAAPGTATAAPGSPEASTAAPSTSASSTPVPNTPGPTGSGPSDDPTAADDPLVALAALLKRRDECIRAASVLCLDDVAQPGSAALASDVALVRSIQAGGELPAGAAIEVGRLRLVERLGDSALVDLGLPENPASPQRTTASTLMMRGEAGWRIRDYLSAAPDG